MLKEFILAQFLASHIGYLSKGWNCHFYALFFLSNNSTFKFFSFLKLIILHSWTASSLSRLAPWWLPRFHVCQATYRMFSESKDWSFLVIVFAKKQSKICEKFPNCPKEIPVLQILRIMKYNIVTWYIPKKPLFCEQVWLRSYRTISNPFQQVYCFFCERLKKIAFVWT